MPWSRSVRVLVTIVVITCTRASAQVAVATTDSLATQIARSPRGMVVSGSPLATTVGARVLEQGGNAVDAAVATAFALAVVEPTMSGIGGRTQLLIRTSNGSYVGIDGGTAVPASYPPGAVPADEATYGYRSIGVPGTVAALTGALERYGTRPLAEILAPAIQLARAGFVLSREEAARIASDSVRLREFEGSRRYFLKADGTTYRAGERFIQTDLATTLETVARGGARAFYQGRIADLMVADLARRGNWMLRSDLEGYRADSSLIVYGNYRGYDLIGTYLPASGVTTIETLHILENFDLAPIAGGAQWAALVTQALLLAFEDRVAELGPADRKAATLTSKSFARDRARQVRLPVPARDPAYQGAAAYSYEPEHTTHLSVADGRGGVVALTQSLGPNLGSRVAAPGLGFLYAATMGYLGEVKPGDRPFSSQSPLIVAQGGVVRHVLGAAGARRIIPALVTVLSRSIDQKLSFPDAMAAPRLHALPARIDLESRAGTRWSPEDIADLQGFGFTVRQRGDAPYFARIHGIHFDPGTREYVGVADPRWQGAAAAPRESPSQQQVDLLLRNGQILDGAGNPWVSKDIGITGDRITFVGDAASDRITARETLDLRGLLVTPGLWDVHSHADLAAERGRLALPLLYQGVTTVVLGVDGDGSNNVSAIFDGYRSRGIAVNAVRYVGHGAARGQVMGAADREPAAAELDAMKAYIRKGMQEGAVGLSTGLFYSPGYFAKTAEVIELARVAAEFGGSYDTHDRDLGVAYKGIGYLNSIREGITIAEQAGTPIIFSHFNSQGVQWYGRAGEGAKLIDDARARGVNAVAGQHMYTATNSSLSAYALPRWAVVGGAEETRKRINDPQVRARLTVEIMEMLEPRGGAARIMFSDRRPDLNGRTLADIAAAWKLSVPDAVMKIVGEGNASVMNLDLYDDANTRLLAQKDWMMTCTDGYTPADTTLTSHPRSYGSFTKKLLLARDDQIISLPFAVRGMTSLPASFYGFAQRGLIAEGYIADLAVFDLARIRDRATYERPHQYSEGTVHVIVNGRLALRDGRPTGVLAGRPLPRERGHSRLY